MTMTTDLKRKKTEKFFHPTFQTWVSFPSYTEDTSVKKLKTAPPKIFDPQLRKCKCGRTLEENLINLEEIMYMCPDIEVKIEIL